MPSFPCNHCRVHHLNYRRFRLEEDGALNMAVAVAVLSTTAWAGHPSMCFKNRVMRRVRAGPPHYFIVILPLPLLLPEKSARLSNQSRWSETYYDVIAHVDARERSHPNKHFLDEPSPPSCHLATTLTSLVSSTNFYLCRALNGKTPPTEPGQRRQHRAECSFPHTCIKSWLVGNGLQVD